MKNKIIAKKNEVHPITINRKFSRNFVQRGKTAGTFLAANALRNIIKRHFSKPKVIKFSANMTKHDVTCLSDDKLSHEIIRVVGKETRK